MELPEVEAFIAIAEHGTFTRAAEILRISQPAISRRIELLEMDLGAPLFERLRTGARLTDAGDAFLPYARRALAALRDGSEAVREIRTGDAGTLTLAVVGTLASTSLLERVRAFRAAYPQVRLSLQTANSDGVSRLVTSGGVQLGLRYFADPSPDLDLREVARERLVVVCAAHSRLVPHDAPDPQALAGVPWVGFPRGSGSSGEPFARETERVLVRLGLEDAEHLITDSLTAQKRLIEADFGVGLMMESAIEEERRLGTLRVIEALETGAWAPVYLLQRAGGYRSAAMTRLAEVLAAD